MELWRLMKKKSQTPAGELAALKVLHRTACILGTLVTAYCMLCIALTVKLSFDELRYFSDLGSVHPLKYYLKEIGLAESIFTFLGVLVELMLYLFLHYRVKKGRPLPWGVQYYRIMLVIHIMLFVLTSFIFIWIPYQSPIRKPLDEITVNFRALATVSVLPAALYSIAYLMRVRNFISKEAITHEYD